MVVVLPNATRSRLRFDSVLNKNEWDWNWNGETKRKTTMTPSVAGASKALPPRGSDAPLHDLAGHILPSVALQGGHPSLHLQGCLRGELRPALDGLWTKACEAGVDQLHQLPIGDRSQHQKVLQFT